MSCHPTEHYDSACQNREIQATYAKKNSATTAAMRKHMNAFLKKGSQNPEKHDQRKSKLNEALQEAEKCLRTLRMAVIMMTVIETKI